MHEVTEMVTDVRKLLMDGAKQFMKHMRAKEYLAAKADYDSAICVATQLQIPTEDMLMLFGDQETDRQGLFPLELVQKAYYETTVKGSCEWQNRSFEEFRRGLQAGTLQLKRWHQG